MDYPQVSPLSHLKVGDIFELARSDSPPSVLGRPVARWQVDSIGDVLCGIVMESAAEVPDHARFTTPPLMVDSQTTVIHRSDWNLKK